MDGRREDSPRLAISLPAIPPAAAFGTPDVAHEGGQPVTVRTSAAVTATSAPVAQAAPTRKIRVVLASPFGN